MNSTTPELAITINPATGAIRETFAYLDDGKIEAMLAGAWSGYRTWRHSELAARAARLAALAAALRANAEAFAITMTEEMGKPIKQARAEVEKCASTCDWYAANGAAMLQDEKTSAPNAYVSFLPIGLVFAVTPWNFPIWQIIRGSIPAILAGNAIVLKPAPNVVRSALNVLDAFRQAGFPEGVLSVANVAIGSVPAIIADDRIAGVALTGSVRAGAAVAALAGGNVKRSVLELGGSDPFIVLADADIDVAIKTAVTARFQNTGQVCVAAKRFIVEAAVVEQFREGLIDAVGRLKIGNPMFDDIDLGPMARKDLRDELHRQVLSSVGAGARLIAGGRPDEESQGYYYPPTVLDGVEPGMAAFDDETFGPLAAITVAENADKAIDLANLSQFGLSASLWTQDLDRARTLARRIETGGVFVNSFTVTDPRWPVGGTKKSGYGRELSYFGVREFTNAQTVFGG